MTTKKISKSKKSKKMTTKERVKIGQKIAESKRKLRKEAWKMKKLGISTKKHTKNDFRVPNLCPFKRGLLE